MAGLLKVKWLCAANCIAAGHLALGYFYLVVAADSCSVKIVMAGYVPRYRERALKYGKLVVVRTIVYNFLRTIVYNFQFNMAN